MAVSWFAGRGARNMPTQPTDFNLIPACLFCAALPTIGAIVGWVMRGRIERLGLPWAFLPESLKKWIDETWNK